ncbi:MAG: hypothetical protein JW861_10710, partial [Bacteroidales bacterium]|nr:hypothetical protein [Bacteroidales bacterium]
GGQYELNRVGRPILQKRVDLVSNHFIDYGEWNTFFLSLDEMIRVEPEAIYNIKISFSREYSLYPCSDMPESPEEEEEEDYWYYDEDNSGLDWDSPGYFYESYYPRGFRWNERDNPCHISYYYQERFISRNILASNLGLIAKAGSDGAYTVAVTNLLNAEPLRGARVEFYSFQHQLLTSGTTGNLGTVVLEPEGKPFLLIASSGEQKGYLRLDDGSSLSLSKFPVEGEAIQEGLKGFIYGDRGVWRPGDTLFITFILEDGTRSLPPDHPVIFELLDPAARVIQKTVRTGGSDGFYSIITPTAEDAPTGNYIARISVGNSVFRKNLRVETIKPNRLKIGLDFGTDILVSSRESIWGTLQTRWLHGGRAGNLKANVSLIFRQKTAAFPDYKGFLFEDNSKRHFPEEEVIFDGRLDNEGKASVEIKPGTHREVPGMLSAALMVKVFEPSGEFSTDLVTLPFAPYPRFVGLSLEGTDRWGFLRSDSSYTCRLALVDPRGKPAGSGPVEITVYRMEWRWWWNSQDNDLAGYFSGSYQKPVITQMVNISNGKGQFNLNTEAMDWGRYFIRVTDPAGGHSAGTVFYVRRRWWWDEDAQDQGREFATMLELKTDKEKYRTGENATVTFPAGSTGQAWVTLENGSRVLAAEWVNIHDSRMEYSFEVTPEMTPNVYVYVTLLQPHAQTQNDAPVRLYGVIPVMAEDPASILVPVIKAPAEIRPEETYTLRIREDQGRAMTYTLAVVDEGLLDLTHFRTPDPWDYFYTKEALGVKTWDMFDQVIGAYGGKLERVLAVGGDGSESPPDKTKISRFKPVIRFMGPFRLRPGEEKKHELRMPNYVGSIRVMVIAGNGDQAYGHAEKTIPVKKPLMVLATLPRVLGPGETVTLPVSVFMMEDRQTDVIVKVETNERFVISGDPEKKVRFDRPGEQLLEFDLQVKPVTGAGFVTVTAAMGKEKASYRFDISIRNPNPPVKTGYFTRISAGETWDQPFALPGIKGTNSLQLETTGGLPLNISRHLAYLLDYPYGCAEQITSTAFAQLYLPDLCDLNQEQQERVRTNINLTTQKLIGLQNVDGGFVFWPGNRTSGDFLSSYIGHFMLEAESRGYPVSRGMKRSWISYQKSVSSRWNPDKDPDMPQAYRLFTLALAGESQMAAMNRMREMSRLTRDALSCLASAYAVSGQKEAARELLGLTGSAAEDDQLYRYTYGSMLRNDAMVLLALILADEEEGAERLAFRIAEEFGKEYYYSTQTTAFTLFALSRFTQGKRTDQPLRFTCQLGKQPKQSITTQYHIHWLKWDQLDERDDRIQVRNEGQEELYVRLTVSGTPARDTLPPAGKNLRITTQYTDLEGNMIDPGLLPQGMDFKAQITVSLPAETQRQDHLALSSVFPSGWEIIRRSRSGFEAEYTGGDFDYQDIRDDRVNTFFSLNPGDIKTFVVYLNATYRGRYWLPAVSCEAMYNHDVYARTSGQWVEVAGSE